MDIARLGFSVPTDPIDKAVGALNKLTPAARSAGSAAEQMGSAVKAAAAGLPGLSSGVNQAATGSAKLQSVLAGVAAASNTSARASLAAGTSMANGTAQVNAAVQAHTRLQQQITASTQSTLNLTRAMQVVPSAAGRAGSALDRMGAAANDNINRMQATPGNVAAQFQDVAVTAAGGMSPLLIALQQGTQLSAAFTGGLGPLMAGLRQMFNLTSILTIAAVALIAALIQWGIEAVRTAGGTNALQDALEGANLASSNLGDAQSILGQMFDLTTGKIKDQTDATVALTSAMAMQAKIKAELGKMEAETQMTEITRRKWGVTGGMGGGVSIRQFDTATAGVVDAYRTGAFGKDGRAATRAEQQLQRMVDLGQATKEEYLSASQAIVNFSQSVANLSRSEDMLSVINGERGPAFEQFLNRPKPRKDRGKTDAEKLLDIFQGADADIATQKARELNAEVGRSIDKSAELEMQTRLLNQIRQKELPITDAVIRQVNELASAYGKAVLAADTAEAFGKSILATSAQRQDLELQRQLIGKYGEELLRLKLTQELITKPQTRGIVFTAEQISELTNRVNGLAKAGVMVERAQFMEQMARDAELLQTQLDNERGAFGVTGEAALQYAFVNERLLAAKRSNVALSPAEIAAITAAGAAYAKQRYEMDRVAEGIQFMRDNAKQFFTDWIADVREGQNVFTAFANSMINSLNRIIDKLLDSALNGALNSLIPGGASINGVNASQFSAGLGSEVAGWAASVKPFAKGGIVNSPTLFEFAKGTGLMGEAGPEAIMPLKRGADGSLGVQIHDGSRGPSGAPQITIEGSTYNVGGVTTPAEIMAAIRQSNEQTKQDLARALPGLLSEYQINGTTG